MKRALERFFSDIPRVRSILSVSVGVISLVATIVAVVSIIAHSS